jgi:hypothetical protein
MMSPLNCQKCGVRPGTERYAADSTAFAHGWIERWCRPCVLEKQIATARSAADRLPDLEAELAAALAAQPDPKS